MVFTVSLCSFMDIHARVEKGSNKNLSIDSELNSDFALANKSNHSPTFLFTFEMSEHSHFDRNPSPSDMESGMAMLMLCFLVMVLGAILGGGMARKTKVSMDKRAAMRESQKAEIMELAAGNTKEFTHYLKDTQAGYQKARKHAVYHGHKEVVELLDYYRRGHYSNPGSTQTDIN